MGSELQAVAVVLGTVREAQMVEINLEVKAGVVVDPRRTHKYCEG